MIDPAVVLSLVAREHEENLGLHQQIKSLQQRLGEMEQEVTRLKRAERAAKADASEGHGPSIDG